MTFTDTRRQSRILLWLSAATVAVTMSGCSVPATHAGSNPSDAAAGPVAATVTDGPYTLWQEPQAGYAPIADKITKATKSVALTIYELSDDQIEQALIDAHLSVLYPTLLLWLNLGSPRLGVSRWVRVDGVCTG